MTFSWVLKNWTLPVSCVGGGRTSKHLCELALSMVYAGVLLILGTCVMSNGGVFIQHYSLFAYQRPLVATLRVAVCGLGRVSLSPSLFSSCFLGWLLVQQGKARGVSVVFGVWEATVVLRSAQLQGLPLYFQDL